MAGPGESSFIATQIASQIGKVATSPKPARARSRIRFWAGS